MAVSRVGLVLLKFSHCLGEKKVPRLLVPRGEGSSRYRGEAFAVDGVTEPEVMCDTDSKGVSENKLHFIHCAGKISVVEWIEDLPVSVLYVVVVQV